MNNINAYGKFAKRGGRVYRTSTYLQWGTSDEIFGACVMCNPGAADIKNNQNNVDSEEQELKLDTTMKKLVEMIELFYAGRKIEGRFHIYNLFTLRNSAMDDALEELSQIKEEDILYQDYKDFQNNINEIPWVLLGWGCGNGKKLSTQRQKWINLLKEKNKDYIGKPGAKKHLHHYWHPYQRISKRQEELKMYLINKYTEKILKST